MNIKDKNKYFSNKRHSSAQCAAIVHSMLPHRRPAAIFDFKHGISVVVVVVTCNERSVAAAEAVVVHPPVWSERSEQELLHGHASSPHDAWHFAQLQCNAISNATSNVICNAIIAIQPTNY